MVSYTGIVVNKPMVPPEPKENVSIVFLLTVAGEIKIQAKQKELVLTRDIISSFVSSG